MARPLPDWPRGLREELAAEYVGLSVSSFRTLVANEVAAVRLSRGRKVWLREALDAWLDARAGNVAGSQDANPWHQ
jgi:hypothetical protein